MWNLKKKAHFKKEREKSLRIHTLTNSNFNSNFKIRRLNETKLGTLIVHKQRTFHHSE